MNDAKRVLPELTPTEKRMFDAYTKRDNRNRVILSIGVQGFELSYEAEDAFQADWMRCMLAKALSNLTHNEDVFVTRSILDVATERRRQVEEEGYTDAHDDEYTEHELIYAAECYINSAVYPNEGEPPPDWPWEVESWKPKDYRQDLVRAAALLIAEIDRMDRREGRKKI